MQSWARWATKMGVERRASDPLPGCRLQPARGLGARRFMIGKMLRAALIATSLVASPLMAPRASGQDLLSGAITAYKDGRIDEAFDLANQAIGAAPSDPTGFFVRGTVFEHREEYDKALADYDRVVDLSPTLPLAYGRRGALYFKLGQFEDSIADFNKEIELEPPKAQNHWQRGISYFYAGRYEDGWKQFELSQRTVNPNDYENGIFHFLCMARAKGVAEARKFALKIEGDSRVPMKQIYEVYQGKATTAQVMQAAEHGYPNAAELNDRLFYAHLYLGLFEDVAGNIEAARRHLTRAVENFPVVHYMWDVARIHVRKFDRESEAP